MEIKLYRKEWDWGVTLKPFKPTGRWKLEIIDDDKDLYLEHKGLIFKEWVHEGDIVIREEETHINTCTGDCE